MVKKISIVIAFFLLSTIFGHSNYTVSAEDEIPEWGFYVYMAGDNTLYDELTDDLTKREAVFGFTWYTVILICIFVG